MSYYGSWKIDDNLTLTVNTHDPTTGEALAADSPPAFRVYEDETTTPIVTGTLATLDAANTVGFYSTQLALSAANGFEKGRSYNVYITALVNTVRGTVSHDFQIEAEVDSHTVSDQVVVGTNNDKTDYVLLASEHTDIATAVWSATTRTLTSFGTLIDDIWSFATRTLTEAPPGSETGPYGVATGAEIMEIPRTGTRSYRVYLLTYNSQGQSINADAPPTITAENEAGADRSVNFVGGVVNESPGVYYQIYRLGETHLIEQLTFKYVSTVSGTSFTSVHIALAEDLDALIYNTLVEPIPEITSSADIPASATVRQVLMLLYMDRRNNNSASSTQRQVVNDAGASVLTAPMNDDTVTFTQGKLG